MKAIKSVHEILIGEFFQEKAKGKIIIPPNQRPYSWEKGQIEDYFNDLYYTYLNRSTYIHYFNMITFYRTNSNIEIYDGQQRVTTTYLTLVLFKKVMNCLYDKFSKSEAINLENEYQYIEMDKRLNNVLFYVEKSSQTIEKKLQLYSTNEDMLKIIVDTEYVSKKEYLCLVESEMIKNNLENRSNKRLLDAIDNILSSFEQKTCYTLSENPAPDTLKTIYEYTKTLLDNFQIIRGEISDINSSYKIFELVNHRGKDLSDFDLLKNYFYQIVSTSTIKSDIDELNAMIENMFKKLGDDAEDAIIKHWLIFFNTNNIEKYGNSKKILESIKHGVEYKERENKDKNLCDRDPKEKVAKVFEFIGDIEKKLDDITIFYKFVNMTKEDFYEGKNKDLFNSKLLDYETLKKIFVYHRIATSQYDFVDYYLYFLMMRKQDERFSSKIDVYTEYKKVVSFYLTNSITQKRMVAVESLNKTLGHKLKNIESAPQIDINEALAEFICDKNKNNKDKNDGDYNRGIEKDVLANKLNLPEEDRKGNILKLIFLYMYDSEEFFGKINIFDKFFTLDNKSRSVNIIEEEHIFPRSSVEKNMEFFDLFDLNNDESEMKRRLNWFGNKLLVKREANNYIDADLDKKLDYYLSSDDKFLREYVGVFYRVYTGIDVSMSHLTRDRNDALSEIQVKVKENTKENEKYAIKIEEMWREKISTWYREYDFLGLEELKRKVKNKEDERAQTDAKTK